MMLFTLQRYEFFSKSQRTTQSNGYAADVVYLAKVRIFQQITTGWGAWAVRRRMLFTLQRYEFFSKSQRAAKRQCEDTRCCLPCKGTNFLANHNSGGDAVKYNSDVVYLAKVRIFQQITTTDIGSLTLGLMLFTLQRYEFFSKSQPLVCFARFVFGCCLPCKGTNFLANHNLLSEALMP